MRCNECGYMNEGGGVVCSKCGTNLTAGSSPGLNMQRPSPPSANEGAPTIRGSVASSPAWDEMPNQDSINEKKNDSHISANVIKCPSCGHYPLKAYVSPGNPCFNCGNEGNGAAKEQASQAREESFIRPSVAKTMPISQMNFGAKSPVLRLKDISTGKELEFKGECVELNRSNLDPENSSISASIHAILKNENGVVHIEDKSSNGATFIQVYKPLALTNGSKIIIGNKVFSVEIE